MSIDLLKSISTQKAHKTCYKQGSILHYLGTNHAASLTVDWWRLMPRFVPLPTEDMPVADIPAEEQPSLVEHIGEPQAPAPLVLASPPLAPVPLAPLPSVFSGTHGPNTALMRAKLIYVLSSFDMLFYAFCAFCIHIHVKQIQFPLNLVF